MKYSYRIAARTEAAGKYNPTAPNEGNEDSLAILPDVGNLDAALASDTVLPLPEKGVLMVVADGMGGHNAGEVASQIAVATVRDMFAAERIAERKFDSPKSRAEYLEEVVVEADKNVRANADAKPERQGMGSTIVMAWIVGNEVTVTWCGDSRAYCYHANGQLEMLSEDHSMVQDLVRKKELEYADTFAHPNGNVITRCLGGGGKSNAKPESRQFTIKPGDIVMLCSDGLSGVLFDYYKEKADGTPLSMENLQDILSRPKSCLQDTVACLFDAARRCDWYDNVTAILFELRTYEDAPSNSGSCEEQNAGQSDGKSSEKKNDGKKKDQKDTLWKKKYPLWSFIAVLGLIVVVILAVCLLRPCNDENEILDSVAVEARVETSAEGESDDGEIVEHDLLSSESANAHGRGSTIPAAPAQAASAEQDTSTSETSNPGLTETT